MFVCYSQNFPSLTRPATHVLVIVRTICKFLSRLLGSDPAHWAGGGGWLNGVQPWKYRVQTNSIATDPKEGGTGGCAMDNAVSLMIIME